MPLEVAPGIRIRAEEKSLGESILHQAENTCVVGNVLAQERRGIGHFPADPPTNRTDIEQRLKPLCAAPKVVLGEGDAPDQALLGAVAQTEIERARPALPQVPGHQRVAAGVEAHFRLDRLEETELLQADKVALELLLVEKVALLQAQRALHHLRANATQALDLHLGDAHLLDWDGDNSLGADTDLAHPGQVATRAVAVFDGAQPGRQRLQIEELASLHPDDLIKLRVGQRGVALEANASNPRVLLHNVGDARSRRGALHLGGAHALEVAEAAQSLHISRQILAGDHPPRTSGHHGQDGIPADLLVPPHLDLGHPHARRRNSIDGPDAIGHAWTAQIHQ